MLEIVNTGNQDDFSRPIYKDRKGRKYVDVNCGIGTPEICTITPGFGEPEAGITNYKIVDSFEKKKNHKLDIDYLTKLESKVAFMISNYLNGNLKDSFDSFLELNPVEQSGVIHGMLLMGQTKIMAFFFDNYIKLVGEALGGDELKRIKDSI